MKKDKGEKASQDRSAAARDGVAEISSKKLSVTHQDGGFISLIILIILGLAAAKYFLNWDVFDAADSQQGQSTIGYVRNIINTVWSYIGEPLLWIWREIVWPILNLGWESVQSLIRNRGISMPN